MRRTLQRVIFFVAAAGLTVGCSLSDATDRGAETGGGPGASPCPDGFLLCGNVCMNVSADPAHCGSCGTLCAAGATCVTGRCQCPIGAADCGGICTDLRGDGQNCGACGTVCAGGQVCSAGVCQGSCALPGETQCGTSCVDVQTNASHCGVCDRACPLGASCVGGSCHCPAGTSACASKCADLATDAQNCGQCGVVCGTGQACQGGVCTGGAGTGGTGGVPPAGGTGGATGGAPPDGGSGGTPPAGGTGGATGGAPPDGGNGGAPPTGGAGGETGGAPPAGGAGDGPTSTEVTIEEGELGFCSMDGIVESTNAGFSGTGYVNTDNAVGAGIEWAVAVGEAGTYSLEFTYANASADRTAALLVNGTAAAASLPFATTSAWTTWSVANVDVTLAAGENRLVLEATGAEGLANVDRLTVSGAAVGAFDCSGIGTGGTGAGGTGGGGTGGATGGAGGAPGTCDVVANGHYQLEDLDRGVVAVRGSNGNYVGWRMMGYEYRREAPGSVSYRLYRDGALVADVTDSTNYFDSGAAAGAAYSVSLVIDGTECPQSSPVTPWSQNYVRIPLSSPGAYEANDVTPADLDGDGQYELVLKWQPANAKDNSQAGVTDNTLLEGLELDGTSLWRIDLGRNIRSGAHYTQLSVYDFDGDGRAEVAVKTAPGTRDGTGAYLTTGPAASDDDGADYRNGDGYVLSGPEYVTVFDGRTGAELATVSHPVPRGNVGSWGDDYGNRLDRYNAGVAMVTDGGSASGRPSLIRQRGYYTRLTVSALHWRDGQLSTNWIFDSNDASGRSAAGQGNHSAMAADMDGDGAQEVNTGATTIGSDGTFRCTTGRGHGDAQHVGELVPGRGISVFTVYEGGGGYSVHSGDTCQIYAQAQGGDDNGRGVAEDVHPGSPGAEFWSATSSNLMSCADGSNVGSEPSSQNFLIYWDADESRELQDGASISKYGGGTLLSASGCAGNNGTKNTPGLVADLLGDWREELVVRESDNSALRVYTTTAVTARRIYTLMHDPTYRMQVTWEQSSYNQPPHTGFHLGSGMAEPPVPDIHVR